VFAALGIRSRGPLLTLAVGICLQVALQLLHDDIGIHTLGPIHLSETLPGLVLLATGGVLTVFAFLKRYAVPTAMPRRLVGSYILGGLALFTAVHCVGLLMQAMNSARIYEPVTRARLANAVVVGDPPKNLIHTHPGMRETGSWVHWFPPPDPYFRDDVIFAYAKTDDDLLRLKHAFPGRQFYRMTYHQDTQRVVLTSLEARP
jgi:hypothetical protein